MARSAFADEAVTCRSNRNVSKIKLAQMASCFQYPELIVSVPVDRRESRNVVASLSRAPELAQHIGMRIPGACCVWVFLCGSGSRFQFRVRDFRPRTQKVFCGQEFCGFKLTFRFCNFLDVNFQDFVWKFFLPKKFFNPGKRHISAPPEMRRNAEISMAAES